MSPLLRKVELDRIARERSNRIDHEGITAEDACFFSAAAGMLLLLSYLALAA